MSRVLIRFEGEGSGVGELSWGQQEIWRAIRRYGNSMSLGGVTALPDGTTVDSVAAGLGFLVGRHQSLRTRLTFHEHDHHRDHAYQVVADRGVLKLEVVDTRADPAKAAEDVLNRLSGTNFDYENEWPLRVAVIRHQAAVTHMIAVYCHLALDQSGMDALVADLANRDPETGLATRPITGTPPLEQAEYQGTVAARQQSETALRYWERMLRLIPAQRFRGDAERDDAERYVDAHFTSPAIHVALTLIAARNRIGTAPVLLAAYSVALARVTGRNPSVARVVVGNRFRPGFADSVSTVNHPGLCVVDVAGIGFAEAVTRAARSSMNAYKHAYYDPVRRDGLIAEIGRERGEPIDLSCFFNDRRRPDADTTSAGQPFTAQDVDDVLGRSTMQWDLDPEQAGERLFVHVEDVPGAVLFKTRANTAYFSQADLEALLREIEAVLVEAVSDADAATDAA